MLPNHSPNPRPGFYQTFIHDFFTTTPQNSSRSPTFPSPLQDHPHIQTPHFHGRIPAHPQETQAKTPQTERSPDESTPCSKPIDRLTSSTIPTDTHFVSHTKSTPNQPKEKFFQSPQNTHPSTSHSTLQSPHGISTAVSLSTGHCGTLHCSPTPCPHLLDPSLTDQRLSTGSMAHLTNRSVPPFDISECTTDRRSHNLHRRGCASAQPPENESAQNAEMQRHLSPPPSDPRPRASCQDTIFPQSTPTHEFTPDIPPATNRSNLERNKNQPATPSNLLYTTGLARHSSPSRVSASRELNPDTHPATDNPKHWLSPTSPHVTYPKQSRAIDISDQRSDTKTVEKLKPKGATEKITARSEFDTESHQHKSGVEHNPNIPPTAIRIVIPGTISNLPCPPSPRPPTAPHNPQIEPSPTNNPLGSPGQMHMSPRQPPNILHTADTQEHVQHSPSNSSVSSQHSTLTEEIIFDSDHGSNSENDSSVATPPERPPRKSSDHIPYGDFTHLNKPKRIMRLYAINIRGLALTPGQERIELIAQQAAGASIDSLALIATDTNWQQHTKALYMSAFRKHFARTSTIHAQLYRKQSSKYQPGGNCLSTFDRLIPHITAQDDDPLGRWVSTTYQVHNDLSFVFIAAYCPTRDRGRYSHMSSYRQQVYHMIAHGTSNPDPIRIFYFQLQQNINAFIDKGIKVILAIDANCHNDTPGSSMDTLMERTGLADAILAIHPEIHSRSLPRTYISGRRRIDFLCCSYELLHAIDRVGYDAFGEIFDSDHRGMTLDLDWAKLLGTNTPLDLKKSRILTPKRRDHIIDYKTKLRQYFNDHHIARRTDQLKTMLEDGTPSNQIAIFTEALDNDITRGMLAAEKNCKTGYTTPYTSKVANLRRIVGYWNLRWRAARANTELSPQLEELSDRIQWPDITPPRTISLEDIKQFRKIAINELRDNLRKAQNAQQMRMYEAYSYENPDSHSSWNQVYNELRHIKTKTMYHRFRACRGKTHTGGVDSVSIPNGDTWTRLTDPNEIANAIYERNIPHFSQAEGTPFTDPFIYESVKSSLHDPIPHICERLRPHLPPAAQEILNECCTHALPKVNMHISVPEIKNFFRKWSMDTSTSPSGRTLPHYKILLTRDQEPFQDVSNDCWHCIATICSACIQHGFSLKRWQRVHNTMIFKKPGDDRINRMRVIHIFEADYNLILGVIWKRVNDQAEEYHALGDQQWGSRRGRHCEDVLFLKLIANEVSRFSRTTLAIFENDAKSCYDRVVMILAFLITLRFGMTAQFALMSLHALHFSRFYFANKGKCHGAFYSPSTGQPVHGCGQGQRPATYSWTNVSACAMEVLRKNHSGAYFCTPDQTKSHTRVIEGIVDDTSLMVNTFLPELQLNQKQGWSHMQFRQFAHTCTDHIQTTAQHWENLLWATGGALELSKCWYHLTHWIFDDIGNATQLSLDQIKNLQIPPIRLDNSSGGKYEIQNHDVRSAHRTLGFMASPSGQQQAQYDTLLDRAQSLARSFSATFANPKEAKLFYSSIVIPSITYANSISSLSQQQGSKIDSITLRACITKMGFNKATPYAMMHAPARYQGQAMIPFWCLQGSAQVLALIEAMRMSGPQNDMAVILMEWVHIYVGTSTHPITNPDHPHPPIPEGWIDSIVEFMRLAGLSINFPLKPIKPRRQGDQVLMDRAVQYTAIPEYLKNINHCRLYLQAETLSDICTALGNQIHPMVLSRTQARPISTPRKFFPIQNRPHARAWMHFTTFIRRIFCGSARSSRLSNPLGRWYPDHIERTWNAYYEPTFHEIWIPRGNAWQSHQITRQLHFTNTQCIDPIVKITSTNPPETVIPVDTYDGGLHFSLPTILRRRIEDPADSPLLLSIEDMILHALPFDHYILKNTTTIRPSNDTLLRLPSLSIAIAARSHTHYPRITSSWHVFHQGYCLHHNTFWVGGTSELRRGHAYGLYSLLKYIQIEQSCYGTPCEERTLWVYCPCPWLHRRLQILTTYKGRWHRNIYTSPHFDILQAIIHILSDLKLKIQLHTSVTDGNNALPYRHAIQSCDALLTHEPPPPQDIEIPIPGCPANIFLGSRLLTSNERFTIKNLIPAQEVHKYYARRFGWAPETVTQIDWPSREKAASKFQHAKFITKMSCEWLPTNHRLHIIDGIPESCALCGDPETLDHICTCPMRAEINRGFLHRLQNILDQLKTPQPTSHLIMDKMTHSIFPHDTPTPPTPHPQDDIGWAYFRRGFLSLQFYHDGKPQWSQHLIRFLFQEMFDLWILRNNQNTAQKINRESEHNRNRMRAKAEELYTMADQLPSHIRIQLLPEPLDQFLSSHSKQTIFSWYDNMKPTIRASLGRYTASRNLHLTPTHPSNLRTGPDP